MFFNTGPKSLAFDKNNTNLFLPITANTIWLICIAIQYVLEEYKSGIQIIYKFETNTTVTGKSIKSFLLYLLKHIIDSWEQQ